MAEPIYDPDLMPDDSDLVYDPKTRKRPPGASDVTVEVWKLLYRHPGGLTIDEICAAMAPGWMFTDTYRAYAREREHQRKIHRPKGTHPTRGRKPALEYGTPKFKAAAQRWRIQLALASMSHTARPTARRDDGRRWYVTERPPNVQQPCNVIKTGHVAPLNVEQLRREEQANRDMVRREHVKAALMAAMNDPKASKQQMAEACRTAYNYLSGR